MQELMPGEHPDAERYDFWIMLTLLALAAFGVAVIFLTAW
jgi:hypothetical protein